MFEFEHSDEGELRFVWMNPSTSVKSGRILMMRPKFPNVSRINTSNVLSKIPNKPNECYNINRLFMIHTYLLYT